MITTYDVQQSMRVKEECRLEVDGAIGLTRLDGPTALQAARYLRGQGHRVRILDHDNLLSHLDEESRT